MKVFVAGASGAIGRQLLPFLKVARHTVVAMTRTPAKAVILRALGAEPLVADVFDRQAVQAAIQRAAPDVVVHELTALANMASLRNWDEQFAATNRLRVEALDILLEAARLAGTRRFIAQSFAGWPYARVGGWVKTETDLLDPTPLRAMSRSLAAIQYVETAVPTAPNIQGLVLRYGFLYGPGTALAWDGQIVSLIRAGHFPIVGDGRGVWSFTHVDDAATATLAAIDRGSPGIYNIVDDDPAPVGTWLPELARIVGARPPKHVPAWLGRITLGDPGVLLMTEARGASNAKAARELGWRPSYTTWREGFRQGLAV
jgi:nucleoside-diphosphate-sugar epimerase